MTRTPRDLSGKELEAALGKLGYYRYSQKGSHVKLRRETDGHKVTITAARSVNTTTLNQILRAVAEWNGLDKQALIKLLFEDH